MNILPLINLEFLTLLEKMRNAQKQSEQTHSERARREAHRLAALVDSKISGYRKQIETGLAATVTKQAEMFSSDPVRSSEGRAAYITEET